MSLRKCIRCNYRGPSFEHCGWMTKPDGDQYTSDPIHSTSPAFYNPTPSPTPDPEPTPSFTPDPPSTPDFEPGGGGFGGGGASGDY